LYNGICQDGLTCQLTVDTGFHCYPPRPTMDARTTD
jgi:hypothetical protein